MTPLEILRARRDDILRLAASYGARNVRIFGSVARGDATQESDVDMLVEMEHGRTYLEFTGLWLDLQELLGQKVDLLCDGGISPYMADRVYAEAVPL